VTHLINPTIDSRQMQVITGTILGGSSIIKPTRGKNCYLSMRSKDGLWLDHKAAELSSLASAEPVTIEKTNRWHSLCYPIFNEFRSNFYKGKKRKLRKENLDPMKDIALAVWFGDCGKLVRGKVVLNTHIWKGDSDIIAEYLSECGYECEVFKERGNYRVRLEDPFSKKFLALVMPHLPPFMILRLANPSGNSSP